MFSAILRRAALAVLLLALPARAQPALDRADLETWLDGLLPNALARGDIAGGVVVVVKDGQVLLQKGYGYADVEKKLPVDPDRTLFRFGSVSKLFTWTAVMQLVEQGKLDLDRDVNAYLDFKIPATFGKPVTLRHLMTHTGGFEETVKGMMVADPAAFPTLEHFVKVTLPPQIYAPGTVPAYSNYGTALAGYIVQRVSGEDYLDYVERHVFQPLGMQHSTMRQPLPQNFVADMSRGYWTADAPLSYFELCGPIPAGALSATGADAARFMLAHLAAERGAETGLLRPETAKRMHDSVSRPIAAVNGMSLGFDETRSGNRRSIGHSGDTQVFHSNMELFLDDGVGIFAVFNSRGRDGATYGVLTSLFDQFADRYLPADLPHAPTAATAAAHAQQIVEAGPYRDSRRAESSFLSMLSLLQQQTAELGPNGTLLLSAATNPNGSKKIWREVAPYLWVERDGGKRMAANVENGVVRAVGFEPLAGTELLQPVPPLQRAAWILPVLLASVATLAVMTVAWPVTALVRRRFGVRSAPVGRAKKLLRGTAVANLLFLLGWAVILQSGLADFPLFNPPLDPWIRLVQALGVLGAAGSCIAVWTAIRAWREGWTWKARLGSAATAASGLFIAWFALAFGLLTVSLRY